MKPEVLRWREACGESGRRSGTKTVLTVGSLPGSVSISVGQWTKAQMSKDVEPRGRGAVHGRRQQAQERCQGGFLRLGESCWLVGVSLTLVRESQD